MERFFEIYALLLGRPSLYRLHRALFRFALAGIGVLNWRTEDLRGENGLLGRLLPKAPEGAVVLDVGANEGAYSQKLLDIAPWLKIHAFEPHPETFKRLQLKLEPLGVRCWNVALGEADQTADLYDYSDVPEGSSHASLHGDVFPAMHHKQASSVEIRVRRLGDILEKEQLDDIFLLKIDTEGNESAVLRGLGDMLTSGKVRIRNLQLEFGDMNVVSHTFFEDLQALLPGYRVNRILPYGRLVDVTAERAHMKNLFAYQNLYFTEPPSKSR